MAIVINGSGTVTGISVGGLPDGIVDADMLAANAVASGKIASGAITAAKLASGVGGKVLQYIVGTTTSQSYTSSTSYVDTGLTATITPSSGTKILVIVSQPTFVEMHNTSGSALMFIQVLRDSTLLGKGSNGETLTSNGSWSSSQGTFAFQHLDTHGADGSTAVTYKTQYRHYGSAGQSYVQRTGEVDTNRSTITLLELAV